ncbi:hypothetical protein CE143_14980 [Photorhabdus luminescens]|uniref:Uncharacterized protein n=1 Tax=Photorhabdus akhurstii TaxID=171438 RepID=A0ABX8LZP9_9GAMM|nr:hypothetical protein [Photorhabdus akhurstii]QXF34308.1 hypothetical protein B0X70_14985 [Photorhabdus akhurstii]UJD76132.1 hypothetical protein CE143_14980 [Photorhabdus luminescens]
MELEKLLKEIRDVKNDIERIEHVIYLKADGLCISVINEPRFNAPADNKFLIDALNSKKIELTKRLKKLNETKQTQKK